MDRRFRHGARRTGSAFTLVELLTVIAIIGILSSLLFVTFGGATSSARRAKTKVQFAQWASAMESFRQEYGFYPDFSVIGDDLINSASDSVEFVEALSGRRADPEDVERFGERLSAGDPGWDAGNTKSIQFCSFGQDDLDDSNQLIDAFENPEIAILMDRNYDGLINAEDVGGTLPSVGSNWTPAFPDNGVRASVIFYSAGAGKSPSDIVTSW